jgi:chemotaxis protein methyltransferase CheR
MSNPIPIAPPVLGTPTVSADNFAFLQKHVYAETGIVLDDTKVYLVESRLAPVAKDLGLGTIDEMCALLKRGAPPETARAVMEAMTTHETLFFRDPAVFEALRTVIFPELVTRLGAARRLNIWSAAASSGQEPVSLAILLHEMGLAEWDVQIFATDLSRKVLAKAEKGRFSTLEVNRGLAAPLLVKYFKRQGLEWEAQDSLRRMIRYQQMDLRKIPQGVGPFDLVLCRNVLIYFDTETKRQIVMRMAQAMRKGSSLILGAAETLINIWDGMPRKTAGSVAFYQIP